MSASTNAPSALPRGTIKRFREYLNVKFCSEQAHRHARFRQMSRGYGDYLYHQDREKFDVELADALAGVGNCADFLQANSKETK